MAEAVNLRLDKRRIRLITLLFRQFLTDLKEMDELDLGEEPLQLVLRFRQGK